MTSPSEARTSETVSTPDLAQRWRQFHEAFRELRKAFIAETGGGNITMKMDIRDASAEAAYQKRRKAAAARKKR